MKTDEFANIVDQNEVAHNEPTDLDQHCLTSSSLEETRYGI